MPTISTDEDRRIKTLEDKLHKAEIKLISSEKEFKKAWAKMKGRVAITQIPRYPRTGIRHASSHQQKALRRG